MVQWFHMTFTLLVTTFKCLMSDQVMSYKHTLMHIVIILVKVINLIFFYFHCAKPVKEGSCLNDKQTSQNFIYYRSHSRYSPTACTICEPKQLYIDENCAYTYGSDDDSVYWLVSVFSDDASNVSVDPLTADHNGPVLCIDVCPKLQLVCTCR